MGRYYLGIDIGTYESRGVLVDERFRVVADASAQHGMDNPHPGWYEHDAMGVWWSDFCSISKSLIAREGIDAREIACVGSSALGTDCLPVDSDLNPLRPAILYGIDARAEEEARILTEHYGHARVRELFGHPICSGDTATKILWIRRNEPAVFERAHKFLTGSSFLTARLTGRCVIDRALAEGSFRPLYHGDGSLDEAECSLFCEPDQVAESVTSTDIVGTVTAQAAQETGLVEGTPVICGTGDSTSEGVSVGLVTPGTAFFQYGSTMYYYYCIDRSVSEHRSKWGLGSIKGSKLFTVPGTWCLGDGTNAAGALTKWVRDVLYAKEFDDELRGGESAWQVMAREAASVPPLSHGLMLLPYIYGERSPLQDPKASGMLFGLRGTHGRSEVSRAALEAIGFSTLQHVCLFEEMGLPPERVIVAGGGTRNATWMQIIADMLGISLAVPLPWQSSSYGDALMAAIGIGDLGSFEKIPDVLPNGQVIEPDAARHVVYEDALGIFIDLYNRNKDAMHELDELAAASAKGICS